MDLTLFCSFIKYLHLNECVWHSQSQVFWYTNRNQDRTRHYNYCLGEVRGDEHDSSGIMWDLGFHSWMVAFMTLSCFSFHLPDNVPNYISLLILMCGRFKIHGAFILEKTSPLAFKNGRKWKQNLPHAEMDHLGYRRLERFLGQLTVFVTNWSRENQWETVSTKFMALSNTPSFTPHLLGLHQPSSSPHQGLRA